MDVAISGVVAALVAAIVSALVSLWNQARDRRQRDELLQKELEHQTREALRNTYGLLLTAQRRSRELSLRLAEAAGATTDDGNLAENAIAAHAEFIDRYHQLNLDSSRDMWLEVRGLRDVLDRMLEEARAGHTVECSKLAETARDARQNLERSFRQRLGYEAHQQRRPLGTFDKVATQAEPEDTL